MPQAPPVASCLGRSEDAGRAENLGRSAERAENLERSAERAENLGRSAERAENLERAAESDAEPSTSQPGPGPGDHLRRLR